MKHLITRLLLIMVAVFSVSHANAAADKLYLIGQPVDGGFNPTKGIGLSKVSDGVFETGELNFSSTQKFKFSSVLAENNDAGGWNYVDGYCYGPKDASSAYTLSAGSFDVQKGNTQDWALGAGKWKITVNTNDMKLTVVDLNKKDLYIYCDPGVNKWGETGTKLSVNSTYNLKGSDALYFVFGTTQKNDWTQSNMYGASVNNQSIAAGNYEATSNNKNVYKLAAGDYTIKVTGISDTKVSFTVTDNGGVTPLTPSTDKVYLFTNEGGGWAPRQEVGVGDTYTLTGSGDSGNLWLMFSNDATYENSDKWWGNQHHYAADKNSQANESGNTANFRKRAPFYVAAGKKYTVTITDVSKDNYVKFTVVEKGDPAKANKVYLIGSILNNNVESPAWEMTRQDNGTYVLNGFAMRSTDAGVIVYDESGKASKKEFGTNYNGYFTYYNPDIGGTSDVDKYQRQPGWMYNAEYNPSNNTLTVSPVSGGEFKKCKDIMPYVGILGMNFRQATNYRTRLDYSKGGDERMGHTDDGWQEAYIEYDNFGNPIIGEDGKAYYNTIWPARNAILMDSYIGEGVDPLKINNNDLTMKLDNRGIMKGSDWTTALQQENSTEYVSDFGNGKGFRLDGNTYYARYYVTNMWMMGEYKIWTGWGGQQVSWGAQWNTHFYWGPGGKQDNASGNKRVELHDTFRVPNSDQYGNNNFHTEHLGQIWDSKKGKNVNNYAREYYRTMEVFVPVGGYNESTNEFTDFNYRNARIYLTEADGGAKIDAVARQNQYVGYNPTLANIPNGYHVKDYTVTRYQYDPNKTDNPETNNFVLANGTVVNSKAEACVKSGSFNDASIFKNDLFNALFTKDSETFSGKYTYDGVYSPGRYIFRLEVTFASNGGDKIKTADVWSPYVEIFEAENAVTINADQLIELPAGVADGYNYVTYDSNLNAVLVAVDANDKVSEIKSDNISNDKLLEVYEQTGKWTNKALLRVSEPSRFTGTKTKFDIKKDGNNIADLINNGNKIGSYYVLIEDNKDAINSAITFTADFEGQNVSEGGSATATGTGSTVYTPSFMLPALGTAEIYLEQNYSFCGSSNDATATHEHLNYVADNDTEAKQQKNVAANYHELTVTVPVLMPNIVEADGLKKAVYDLLTLDINGAKSKVVANSTDYNLVFRHQSPYDWMKLVNGEWVSAPQTWNLSSSNYGEVVNAIPCTLNGTTGSAALAPSFTAPAVDANDFWFRTETEKFDGGYHAYVYVLSLDMNDNNGDAILDNNVGVLSSGSNVTTLIKTEGAENIASISNAKYVNKVWTKAEKSAKVLIASVDVAGANENQAYGPLMEWINSLKINVAYAYYFDCGQEISDAAHQSKSHYNGFTGEFPYIRKDHQTSSVNRIAPSNQPPSTTLAVGDNAFLFAPKYKEVNVSENRWVVTGIEDVIADLYNITVGEGFIDLNGNNGMIYSADGRMVYNGAARADVAQGVYVINLGGATFKVIVK